MDEQQIARSHNNFPVQRLEQISNVCHFIFLGLFIFFIFSSCKKININEVSGPVINDINPSKAIAGTVVTLTGKYFGKTVEQNKVFFDGQQAFISNASDTRITVESPSHVPGIVDIKVMVNGKESKAVHFEYGP